MLNNINSYISVLKNRDFSVLIATVFVGQLGSAFLLLFQITTVFQKTGSDFGVSSVVLSLSIPALFLMTIAGLVSDIVDRRKIILIVNVFITFVVAMAFLVREDAVLLVTLSFLYFAANSFFFPAVTAAGGQLLKKNELMYGNSFFFLMLAGGQLLGLFSASIIQFFWSSIWLLVGSEIFLVLGVLFAFLLPNLVPRKERVSSVLVTILDIWRFVKFIFSAKTIWFYFIIFALTQGIVAFGATLGPGFFDSVIGLTIDKSPLLIFPSAIVGILIGTFIVHLKIKEGLMVSVGMAALGVGSIMLGIVAIFGQTQLLLMAVAAVFLILGGFGMIVVMIASRTVLQKRVLHKYQGSVFGASFVLSSLVATIMSPMAATLVALFGYAVIILLGGIVFLFMAALVGGMRRKWIF